MPRKSELNKNNEKKQNKKKTPKKGKNTNGKENTQKVNPKDAIEVSKQLLAKRNLVKKTSHSKKKDNNLKIYENAKPMPHLADLEKMYEDSDDENTNLSVNSCKTPSKQSTENVNVLSPSTIQAIASQLMDKMSNIDPIELLDELPPPPVVPPKKRKKPDEPYIVGCKDRPQVIQKPTTQFCKGSEDYGIDPNSCNEEEIPKKRAKRSKIPNVCKSLFNSKSDKIADMLKDTLSDSSDTSTETIPYDYKDSYQYCRPPSFSPIPSTSRDNETITKNDELFNKTFTFTKLDKSIDLENSTNMELNTKDIEIVETPIEIIVLDDELLKNKSDQHSFEKYDNSVQIIEPLPTLSKSNEIPIDIDDYSSCLNINHTFDDVIEIIDVDEVIAENKSVIEKYKMKNSIETITTVDNSIHTAGLDENKSNNEKRNNDADIMGKIIEIERNNNAIVNNDAVPNVAAEQIICIDDTLNVNDQLVTHNNCPIFPNRPPHMQNNIVTSSPCNRRNGTNTNLLKRKRKATPNKSPIVTTAVNTTLGSPQQNDAFSDCPICMDRLKGKTIASTLCGHVFCMECIKRSIQAIGKKCPKCRKKLKGVGYIQIFL